MNAMNDDENRQSASPSGDDTASRSGGAQVWRWFRLLGLPALALLTIASVVVVLQSGKSAPDSGDAVRLPDSQEGELPVEAAGVGIKPGDLAPDFSLATLDGATVKLSELRGKHVIINFWATWCGPCRSEMPAIEEVYQRHRDDGLVILAINVRESNGDISPYIKKIGVTFPVLLDRTGQVSSRYRVKAMPTTYLINPDGRIDGVREGAYSKQMLNARVDQLLGVD